MTIESLKSLYSLISNPSTKDVKLRAFESLVYGTFLYNDSTKIYIKDIHSFAKENNLIISSDIILLETIEKLVIQGILSKSDDKELVLKDVKYLEKFKEIKNNNEKKLKDFFSFMISSLQNHFDEIFSEELKIQLKHQIKKIISEIMDCYSDSVVDIYNGEMKFSYSEDIDILVRKNIVGIKEVDEEYLFNLEQSLIRVFKKQFLKPDQIFADALRLFATSFIATKVIIKNPSMEGIKKEFFKDVGIFIDTNVMISLLCSASSYYEITNDLLFETKKLGGKIFLSKWTLDEFKSSLDNAKYIFNRIKEGKINPLEVDNEIVNTYYQYSDKYKNWFELNSEIKNNLNNLLKQNFIELISCDEPDEHKLKDLEDFLTSEYAKIGKEKIRSLITHDAKMILHIQGSRNKRVLTIGTNWLLTRDENLRKFEKIILKVFKFYSEGLISCDIWFEILLPFIETEIEEKEISKTFSKLLGVSLMAIPYDVVDNYIQHLSIELDLDNDTSITLKKRIEDVHIRNILEIAINKKDYEGANHLLKDSLGDYKEKEDYQKIIRRLVTKVRDFETSVNRTFINIDKLNQLKSDVIDSKTNDEKGKTLEKLATYLFGKINGLKIVDTDVRLEAEEIDIIIHNSAFPQWSDPILVECKNWSKPVPAKEISNFMEKIRSNASKTGILIAFNGITGDEYKDAGRKLRDALVRDQTRILVFDWRDIEKIQTGEDWIDLLYNRYYKLFGIFKNKEMVVESES